MVKIPRPSNRARGFVRRRLRTGCFSERLRCQCLQALWRFQEPENIAQVLDLSLATVYRTVARYRQRGVLGVLDGRTCRRPAKVNAVVLATLTRLLQEGPSFSRFHREQWTMETLSLALRERAGISLHFTWVWQLVRRMDWVRKRARPMVRRCNPKRRWQWASLVRALWSIGPQEVLLFADEVDIDFNPKPGYLWLPRGVRAEVETPGRNQKRYLAGALNVDTGKFYYVEGEHKRSGLFITLLERLRKVYRYARKIHLLVDNYSIHKSRFTRAAVDSSGGRVVLHFLPGYSPEYNPVEWIWQQLHAAVTRTHRCRTMTWLMRKVRCHLDSLGRIRYRSPLPFQVRRHGLVLATPK